MSNPSLTREQVHALLQETDCPDEFIRRFLSAMETAETQEQLRLLRCQRCRLLERLHTEQRKLYRLDYLRYQLGKPESPQRKERSSANHDK